MSFLDKDLAVKEAIKAADDDMYREKTMMK